MISLLAPRIKAPRTSSDLARVLIVDDSVVARTALSRMVEAVPGCELAGSVPEVRRALEFLAGNSVDVILLDIEMPGVDGLTALPDLLSNSGQAKVLIVSSSATDGAAQTIQALALGAADTLVKPQAGGLAGRFEQLLREKLMRLIETEGGSAKISALPVPPKDIGAFDIIAIGASTGGIHALSQLLRQVPQNVDEPILITQHLPANFMPYFATQIAVLANRPCVVATDFMPIERGRIIVAPGTAHLTVARSGTSTVVRLKDNPARSGCMPSVDPMLESIGQVFGDRALGIVLSGMGRDGEIGAGDLVKRGGRLIAQDQDSSVIWGMPGSVVKAGLAKLILPPDEIGRVIASRRRFG